MGKIYQVIHFEFVSAFLEELPINDRMSILAGASKMEEGNFQSVYIKTLRGSVKELIVRQYRILFFIHGHHIYFVRVFIKKTRKTPSSEIDYVERVYKMFINKISI